MAGSISNQATNPKGDKQMKTNNIIKSLIAITITAALFVSCTGANSSPEAEGEKTYCTLCGTFSAPDNLRAAEQNSRSATSSFTLEGDFDLLANHKDGTIVNGSVKQENSTWSVNLDKAGQWNIVLRFYQNDECIMVGNTSFELESITPQTVPTPQNINLGPVAVEEEKGAIKLEIISKTDSVSELSYVLYGSELSNPIEESLDFTNSKVTISQPSLKAGVYELELSFKDSTGALVYFCKEQVPVYYGFTTDTWYGQNPYFVSTENDTSFVITEELVKSFNAVQNFPKDKIPLVLYDLNYSEDEDDYKEVDNQIPGLRVVESITENQTLEDGLELAKNKKVIDFVIDQETQAIYTLEFVDTGKVPLLQLVAYPSYAGYAYGKTIISKEAQIDEIRGICFNNGYLYVLDTNHGKLIKISLDGEVKEYALLEGFDDEGNPIEFSTYRLASFAIYGEYFYCAYGLYGDSEDENRKIVIEFDKFKFDEENEQLVRVDSLEQAYSNTELPCNDFEYYDSESIKFTDIQVMPDAENEDTITIFTTCVLETYSPEFITLGGLFKLSTQKAEDGELVLQNLGGKTVFGWFMQGIAHTDDDTDENTWFYGPRKILAKKPDELVIVDEGTYSIDNNNARNKNRVVTVNLKDFSMSVVNVNVSLGNTGFPGSSYIGPYKPNGCY